MNKKRFGPRKITKTKLQKILQKKYACLKKENPSLNEAELDELFIKKQAEYKKQKLAKLRKREERKRIKNQSRKTKNSSYGKTGRSVWTVSGGGVSPK